MLSAKDNELISCVGPSTPMGAMMREYWVPALLSSELPAPDSDPVRVLLLGERFIAFRDTAGTVGLLPAQCPHRGASLFFGRNEEGGLRCVYHGWKFDTSGRCLDMPNEPPGSTYKDRVRARAVPVAERGGLVWAYLGSRERPPDLPDLSYLDEAVAGTRQVVAYQSECNWLQGLEGDIDTSHFGFLHVGHLGVDAAPERSFLHHMLADRAPRYEIADTPYGAVYGAYRPGADTDEVYWRIAHFLFPFYTMIPIGLLGNSVNFFARVPLDDHHTMVYLGTAGQERSASSVAMDEDPFAGLKILPNTTDWLGRFRSARNLGNDYDLDRAAQRDGTSYTGLDGVPVQDRAVTESMGPIVDRTQEHLGSADAMVIRVRRLLLRAVRRFADGGTAPPGVDDPASYRQRSGGVVLPAGSAWLDATENLRNGTGHQDVDPAVGSGV